MSFPQSAGLLIVRRGKNFDVAIFSDTISMISVQLCMTVLLIELYPFIPLSMTLTIFKVTAVSNSFDSKLYVFIQLTLNLVALLSMSK